MRERYILQASSRNLSITTGLNRVHTFVSIDGRDSSLIIPVNEWIMPTDNRLCVLIARPETSPQAPDPSPSALVHVFVSPLGSPHNEVATSLGRFEWPPSDERADTLPTFREIEIEAIDPPPCALWREAEPVQSVSDTDRSSILELVSRFRGAILARDVQAAFALAQYRYRDYASAYGEDYASLASVVLEQYRDVADGPDLRAEPLSDSSAVLDIVCGGYVVMVSRGLGREALRFVSGQAPRRSFNGFHIYVAKIGGIWTIVR